MTDAQRWLTETLPPGARTTGFHACAPHTDEGTAHGGVNVVAPSDFGGPDRVCWFTTWTDTSSHGGYWAQHGLNPEARRWFPFYSRGTFDDWLRACHTYRREG